MSLLQVALHVLQLLNELVAMDMKALGTVALLSVVPAVAQYAAGRGPPEIVRTSDLRLQAALFLQHLAKMNLVTAQLLITCQASALPAVSACFTAARSSPMSCSMYVAPRQIVERAPALSLSPGVQGLPVLVGLVESNFKDHGPLVHIGVNCIWRLLELHGTLSMNQICRLLAAAGIAHNLVHALKSVTAQAWLLESKVPLKPAPHKACLLWASLLVAGKQGRFDTWLVGSGWSGLLRAACWLQKPSGVKQGRIASRPDTAAGADPQITERTASHAQAAARTTREVRGVELHLR